LAEQLYPSKTLLKMQLTKPSTLVAAVKAAGLVETLQGKGPLLFFAPTNAAFAKLPMGTVETLLKPENLKNVTNDSYLPRCVR
jgi:uncharacterized surface protein with fasciclin (FAS1) repeats